MSSKLHAAAAVPPGKEICVTGEEAGLGLIISLDVVTTRTFPARNQTSFF